MKIEMNKIQLSSANPRFTEIESLDEKLIKKMISANADYDEEKTLKELINREGDYSNLLNLLQSIKVSGFVTTGDKPVLLISGDKYVVAEGNRRFLSLKLIKNNSLTNLLDPEPAPLDDEIDLQYASDEKKIKDKKANIAAIIKALEDISFDEEWLLKDQFEILEDTVENEEKLWSLIYTKHIAGDRPGIRKWSRSKYFIDILNFFKDGIVKSDEVKRKVLIKIKRNFATVMSDYKYAQFVRDFFINKYGEDWKENMMGVPVSGLQQNFSLSKIKNVAKEVFAPLDIDFDSYFKVSFNDLSKIDYSGSITSQKMFKFIFDWWAKGAIKTRDMASELKPDFSHAVYMMMKNDLVDFDNVSKEKVAELKLEKMTVDQLSRISDNLSKSPAKSAVRAALGVKTSGDALTDSVSDIASQMGDDNVFDILNKQLIHNFKPTRYYNAIAASLRSLYEQILVWGMAEYHLGIKTLVTSMNSAEDSELEAFWIRKMSDPELKIQGSFQGRINSTFSKIRNNLSSKTDIKRILRNITTFSDDELDHIVDFLHDNGSELDKLNEFVHASHRVEKFNTSSAYLNTLAEWQTVISEIYSKLNRTYLTKINLKIEAAISAGTV